MKRTLFSVAAAAILPIVTFAQEAITPDATYLFEKRDTCDLFMDVYNPAEGSRTTYEGIEKPTILFVFGGGFIEGTRDKEVYLPWYRQLTDNGYKVIAIDYRLGLKGSKSVGISSVNTLDKAIHIAVEDLFSATRFLIDNAGELSIDPDNIVISGSSAGAITVLQADYELSNRTSYASILPSDFKYKGVMAFSGAVLSRKGKVKYAETPAPTAFFHGTADVLVNYGQIVFANLGFFGSDKLAQRFEKFGYNYNILRYHEHGHEIAEIMDITVPEQLRFLETNVMKGIPSILDMTIKDPRVPKGNGVQSRKELYGN